jgi:uncharacterized cofD-like protein
MNIVGIGGGTGLPVLLRGLRDLSNQRPNATAEEEILPTAVVCVSDNGGSSGGLRRSFGIPAVGDLRNCLVALASSQSPLADVFQRRIQCDGELASHPLGNLIVTALIARSGSLREAVHLAGGLLQSKGDVLPSTDINATLCAEFQDGSVTRGEAEIGARRTKIRRVWLEPEDPPASSGVIQRILAADAIVLGPGSLYTSIVPNLLTAGVAEAIRNSRAVKIFACNLMTEPGETAGFTASDHVRVLNTYLGAGTVQICLLNSQPVNRSALTRYWKGGSDPVRCEDAEIVRAGSLPVSADLLDEQSQEIRHHSAKLARIVVALTRGVMRVRDIASSEID